MKIRLALGFVIAATILCACSSSPDATPGSGYSYHTVVIANNLTQRVELTECGEQGCAKPDILQPGQTDAISAPSGEQILETIRASLHHVLGCLSWIAGGGAPRLDLSRFLTGRACRS